MTLFPRWGEDAMQPHEMTADDNSDKFLIFNLGGELYGASLTSIKEVIKVGDVKAVPHMKNHFKGIMNLRGQIIGVIDLREKFDLKKAPGQGLILVVEHEAGLIGAIVDELESVHSFTTEQIEKNPMIETKIPLSFLVGVAQKQNRLVNLIDIAGTLSAEDYRTLKSAA